MKSLYLILGILVLWFQMSHSAQSNYKIINEPQQSEDPYVWDFGQVKEGEVLKHDFVLKNENQGILNIKDTNTSCGCTVSEVIKKVLLLGESTLIEVRFNSKGYSGPTQQYVYVHTDSLDNPIIRYIIKAEVK